MRLLNFLTVFILCISLTSAISVCIDRADPSAPVNLSVSGDVGSILLEWGAATDSPDCSGIAEYVISREGIEIGRVDGSVLIFVDNENLGEGEYTYTVYAVDLIGRNTGSAIKNVIEIGNNGKVFRGGSGGGYVCVENWTCEEWTGCVGNDMRRLCNDLNECGTGKNKPDTYQECGLVSPDNNIMLDNGNLEESDGGFFSTITGAVTGGQATGIGLALLFIILIIVGFVVVKKRRGKKKK